AAHEIASIPEPADDTAARAQARDLVARLGRAGWFASIGGLDLRAACLVRETLAGASPLADAMFALQALGTVPILLAGDAPLKERWLPAVLAGRAIASFAMTEPEAGSDAAAIATTARRDGTGYVLRGTKTLISNAGIADRALQDAVAHATRRRQFGHTLGEFQLIQEKLARMATDLTAARLLTYRAAWEKDRGADRVTLEAAMAKAFATEAAQRIVDDAVQILGGQGVLASHPVDRLYRAVRALRIYEGTTEIQHLIVAGQLLKQAGGGGGGDGGDAA